MNYYTCGNCLFADEIESSDMIYCPHKKTHLKVNDPGCSRHKYAPREEKPKACEKCDDTGWVTVETAGGNVAQRCVCLKKRIKKQKKETDEKSKVFS